MENKKIENNILIAEFWGYKYEPGDAWYNIFGLVEHYWIKNGDGSIQRLNAKNFRFDYDWNWLMPVIKKITKLETNTSVLRNAQTNFFKTVQKELLWNDIDNTLICVIKFIDFYNKNKV